jgi:hypothetical protein
VPLSRTWEVAPTSPESWVTSWSRWSISSLALPPEFVIDRIFVFRLATLAAIVLTWSTSETVVVRAWVHWVSAAL